MSSTPSDGFIRCLKTSVGCQLAKASGSITDLIFENSYLVAKLEETKLVATSIEAGVKSTQSHEQENWQLLNRATRSECENDELKVLVKEGDRLTDRLDNELQETRGELLALQSRWETRIAPTVDQGSQCTIKIQEIVSSDGEGEIQDNLVPTKPLLSHPSLSVTHLFRELEEWGIYSEQRWAEGENVDFGKFAMLQEGLHSLLLK